MASRSTANGLQPLLQVVAQAAALPGGQQLVGGVLQQHQAPLKPEAEILKQRLQQLIEQLGRFLGGGGSGGLGRRGISHAGSLRSS
jgi:hypothetical protein